MMGDGCREHRTNEELLEMVKEKTNLMVVIRNGQMKWLGHTLGRDSLVKTVVEDRKVGKKQPYRPRTMLLDCMMVDAVYNFVKNLAGDRESWRCWRSGPALGQRT